MKKYTKPMLNVTKISSVDIIQTSGLVVGGQGSNNNPMEWPTSLSNTSTTKTSVTENMFGNN